MIGLYYFSYLFVCLSICMSICLSVCLSVCLFVCLSVVNFNFRYYFSIVWDRDFIFANHTQLVMPFQLTLKSMTFYVEFDLCNRNSFSGLCLRRGHCVSQTRVFFIHILFLFLRYNAEREDTNHGHYLICIYCSQRIVNVTFTSKNKYFISQNVYLNCVYKLHVIIFTLRIVWTRSSVPYIHKCIFKNCIS